MATLKDIAEKAQVSICTVSRYLNGKIKIRPDTESRINAAIDELGYIPNTVAKSLKTNTSQNVALVIPTINNSYFSEIAAGVDSVLQSKKYSLFIFQHYNKAEVEFQITRKLIENRIAGAIFVGLPYNHDDARNFRELTKSGVAVVFANRSFEPGPYPLVISDYTGGGRQGAKHLLALGHRKIGIISGFKDHPESDKRLHGCFKFLAENGVTVDRQNIYYSEYSHEKAAEIAINLARQGVEAIFSVSDLMAVGALKGLQRYGVKIPDDIALVGFGNTLHARLTTPELTSIDLQSHTVGSKSAEVLINIINGHKVEEVHTLSTKLVRREST
jgi:DNA-binding LacI/PurR family transcriptional regulator